MKLSFAALSVFVSLIAGSAIPVPDENLEKRTVGGVYYCTDFDWKGTCKYSVEPLNTCVDFIAASGWNDVISSFGPDRGTTCNLYVDFGCSGGSITLANPGTGNLATLGMNDKVSSILCWAS